MNGSKVNFINGWKSDIQASDEKGKFIYLIAEFGSLKSDPKQGVTIVRKVDYKSGKTITENQFLTPSKHGQIKATDFDAFKIGVTAKDGYKWIFDIFDGYREINSPW